MHLQGCTHRLDGNTGSGLIVRNFNDRRVIRSPTTGLTIVGFLFSADVTQFYLKLRQYHVLCGEYDMDTNPEVVNCWLSSYWRPCHGRVHGQLQRMDEPGRSNETTVYVIKW